MPVAASIRFERPGEAELIRHLNDLAFGQAEEGRLVDALRENGGVLLSLVAVRDERVVGHALFTPITSGQVSGAALGPIAVHPDYQRQGVGAALISTGIDQLHASGCPFVIVLGHADYYPRFGFGPASVEGIKCQWEVPDEVFMVRVLDRAKMTGAAGLATYRQEFSLVT